MNKPLVLQIPAELHAALKREAGKQGVNAYVTALLCAAHGIPYTPPKWGGDRLAARLQGVYISVANGVATVCKTVEGKTTPALNADDLSDAAAEAVIAQGGGLGISGIYPCPPKLAARAKW